MKAAILVNQKAGSYDRAKDILEDYAKRLGIEIWLCDEVSVLRDRILEAERAGITRLVAAGGDGTVHALISAAHDRLERFQFGIIPLGTGNDLSRTLGIPLDPARALEAALSPHEQRIDLARVRSRDGQTEICVNHISAGLGGQIQKQLDSETKRRWKALSYARSALKLFSTRLPHYRLLIELDGWQLDPFRALNLTIANGRTAGGGFRIAPQADVQDSQLDIVIVKPASIWQMAAISARLFGGDYTRSEPVVAYRAKRVRIRSKPAMEFSVDGDIFATGFIEAEIMPRALRLALDPAVREATAA